MLKQAFGIAFERKFITEDFFVGYYGIKMPKSIVKEEKVTSFSYEDFKNCLNIYIVLILNILTEMNI